MELQRSLPVYQRVVEVRALQIKQVVQNPKGAKLHFVDERFVPGEFESWWVRKYQPCAGDFLVVDGSGLWRTMKGPEFLAEYSPRPTENLTFGQAIEVLRAGGRVARRGWNGKGMWLALSGVDGPRRVLFDQFWATPNRRYAASQEDMSADVLPCFTMKTADGSILMGWLASQTDMLARDWHELSEDHLDFEKPQPGEARA